MLETRVHPARQVTAYCRLTRGHGSHTHPIAELPVESAHLDIFQQLAQAGCRANAAFGSGAGAADSGCVRLRGSRRSFIKLMHMTGIQGTTQGRRHRPLPVSCCHPRDSLGPAEGPRRCPPAHLHPSRRLWSRYHWACLRSRSLQGGRTSCQELHDPALVCIRGGCTVTIQGAGRAPSAPRPLSRGEPSSIGRR